MIAPKEIRKMFCKSPQLITRIYEVSYQKITIDENLIWHDIQFSEQGDLQRRQFQNLIPKLYKRVSTLMKEESCCA